MTERPHSRPISMNEPRSTTASTMPRILYTRRGSRGTADNSDSSRRVGGSSAPTGPRGGASCTDDGRYDRNRRARAKASASVSSASSMVPARAWISAPPSVSLSIGWPNARSTTGGPAAKSCDEPRTISE